MLSDFEKLNAQLILERGQKLSESDIISFVKTILQGDINDFEFKRRLIDNLVYKVYASDDNTYIYFNIKGGNNIEEITLEDTKIALKNSKKVQTQSDIARHKHKRSQGGCSFVGCKQKSHPRGERMVFACFAIGGGCLFLPRADGRRGSFGPAALGRWAGGEHVRHHSGDGFVEKHGLFARAFKREGLVAVYPDDAHAGKAAGKVFAYLHRA